MVEQPRAQDFKKAKTGKWSLAQAIMGARQAIKSITDSPIDAIKECHRGSEDDWIATVEVVESPARMGDNDLLSAYEIRMDATGELVAFQRVGRYHREDAGAA